MGRLLGGDSLYEKLKPSNQIIIKMILIRKNGMKQLTKN